MLQRFDDTRSVLFPFRSHHGVGWTRIHELFENVSKNTQAINVWILTRAEQPVFPLAVMSEVRRRSGDTGGEEQRFESLMGTTRNNQARGCGAYSARESEVRHG